MDSTNLIILGVVFILAQFIHARIVITAIEAAERHIIDALDMPLDDENEIPFWAAIDGPPIDERDFG